MATQRHAQQKAIEQWVKEMVNNDYVGDRWTAFEVGEYHSSGISGLPLREMERVDRLFVRAGGEHAIAAYLNTLVSE
jgi:hypothetical protein